MMMEMALGCKLFILIVLVAVIIAYILMLPPRFEFINLRKTALSPIEELQAKRSRLENWRCIPLKYLLTEDIMEKVVREHISDIDHQIKELKGNEA